MIHHLPLSTFRPLDNLVSGSAYPAAWIGGDVRDLLSIRSCSAFGRAFVWDSARQRSPTKISTGRSGRGIAVSGLSVEWFAIVQCIGYTRARRGGHKVRGKWHTRKMQGCLYESTQTFCVQDLATGGKVGTDESLQIFVAIGPFSVLNVEVFPCLSPHFAKKIHCECR